MVQGVSLPRPILLTLAVLFAAAVILYSAVWMYAIRWDPETQIGISTRYAFSDDTARILSVAPGGAAEQAGLLAGDQLVAINGQPLHTQYPYYDALSRGQVGDIVSLTVERPGGSNPLIVEATLGQTAPDAASPATQSVAMQVVASFPVPFVIVGLGVLFLRLEDRNAWLLALLFGSFIAGGPLLNTQTGIPPPIRGFTVAYKVAFTGLLGPVFFYFFAVFPTPSPIDRRLPWLKHVMLGLAVTVLTPLALWVGRAGSFQPTLELAARVPNVVRFVFNGTLLGGIGLGLVSLLWNTSHATSVEARRKTKVIVFGTLVGMGPIFFLGTAAVYLRRDLGQFPFWVLAPCVVASFAMPLSFAYAVVRHRVLGIPQLLRLGLQYAFARKLLLSLVPLVAGILILDLLLHGNEPLLTVIRARGWVYGTLGGLVLVTHTQRQRWLGALDRTFFRERYDAQRLLGEVVEEVRQAASFDQVAPRAVTRIEAALHAEFVAVLTLGSGETSYHSVAAAPPDRAPLALSADSKLIGLLRLLGKPLEASHSSAGWLTQQLPDDESAFLQRSRIELLVPIASSPDRTQALLALGPKRSEEPYTGEDLSFLVAIASSLALLLERPTATPTLDGNTFTECPDCGTCYDSGVTSCARDRATLTPMGFSRLLTDRYRLERRLGQGGMGTVYEATDTALDRRVAAKVIRENLVGSAEAAQRFQREARATAAFAHPNVVTIHDVGVATGTRAFLVMELLTGTNLRDMITQDGLLSPARTVKILRSVSAAVDAAHARRLVHRDLKPENVFLAHSPTGETPKVLDFGIAKFVSSDPSPDAETAPGTLLGTWRYMSPEQLRGGTVLPAWDLWALGVVAYEMLTGTHPFAAATVEECHRAVLAARFTPLAAGPADLPSATQTFFEHVFTSDASQRPSSALDLFGELERALTAPS
jgi:tRNA A-37 threonylcarbamoyl transferase component Bud32